VRDFITPAEEQALLDQLAETPQPKWKSMATGRRLQYWGGTMSKGGVLLPEPMPGFLCVAGEGF
jgi:alkylated DNA repair protein alkB family protein 6